MSGGQYDGTGKNYLDRVIYFVLHDVVLMYIFIIQKNYRSKDAIHNITYIDCIYISYIM